MSLLPLTAAACLLLTGCSSEAPQVSSGSGSSPTGCVGGTCGYDDAPRTEPPPPVGGLDETLRFQESNGTVGTITLHELRRIPAAEGPDAGRVGPPVSGSYLVADIEVVIEKGFGMATPLTFQVRSPDGTSYPSVPGVTVDRLNAPNLTEGERVRGELAFDAPEGELLIDYQVTGLPLATFQVVH